MRRRVSAGTVLAVLLLFFAAVSATTVHAQASATSEIQSNVKEVYFPFNIYNRVVDPKTLEADADWLKQHPDTHFWIQGYADIRGDVVYNLVLSYHRAQWIKQQLVKRGVSEAQIGYATGWGKLYPVCDQTDDSCFQKNRRVDMVAPGLFSFGS